MKSNWPISWVPASCFFYRDVFLKRPTDIREYAAGGFNQQHKLTRTPIYRQGQSSYLELPIINIFSLFQITSPTQTLV